MEGGLSQVPIIPYIIIIGIFWFLVIKPQKDKEKNRKNMVENLIKNDQIVTSGGIHGRVLQVKDKTVIVRVDDNTKIEFDKESINTVDKPKKEEKKK